MTKSDTRTDQEIKRRATSPWRLPMVSTNVRRNLIGYAFLAPFLLAFVVFMLGPVLAAIAMAFSKWELLRGTVEFNGLDNFRDMADDEVFWISLRNSFYFGIMTMVGTTLLAMGAALAVRQLKYAQTFYRVAFYAPVVLSVSVIGIIFQRILATNGLLNYYLSRLGVSPAIQFLGDPDLVLPSLSVTSIWWGFGFPMLILLAAMYAVSDSLYEAARIDGANGWRLFAHITLPLIRPAMLFVVVTQFIGHFQMFGQSYVMTDGGPGYSSYSMVLYIYRTAWRYYHMGYAGAMALVLALIMFIFAYAQFRIFGISAE